MELPKKIDPLELVAGVGSVALALHWMWSWSGPYRWLAERQLDLFGAYGVEVTLALSALVPAAPLTILIRSLRARGVLRRDADLGTGFAGRVLRWGIPRAAPLALLGVAVWFGASAASMTRDADAPVARVDLAALERGAPPPEGRVEVRGLLLRDAEVAFGEHGGRRYVPLVSSAWTQEDAVAAFVVDPPEETGRPGEPILGRVVERVPGPVRTAIEASGPRVLPTAAVLSAYLVDPAGLRREGRNRAAYAAILVVASAAWLAWTGWRASRRAGAGLVRGR